jgi:hypothetical protein
MRWYAVCTQKKQTKQQRPKLAIGHIHELAAHHHWAAHSWTPACRPLPRGTAPVTPSAVSHGEPSRSRGPRNHLHPRDLAACCAA